MKSALILLLAVLMFGSTLYGQIEIDFSDIWTAGTMGHQIFWELRLPRVILAFFTGALLAVSGMIFQALFRNPMSTPYTLGVASGATLFTAIAIILGLSLYSSLFAFLGAMVTILLLFAFTARFRSDDTASVLLVGIALSFFYSAALLSLFYLSTLQQSYEIVRFTMGSLDTVGFGDAAMIGVSALLLLGIILTYRSEFALLLTSTAYASLRGVDIRKINMILLLAVSLAVGVAVSVTGPIGFVGLITPHIIQILYARSAHRLIAPIFYYGGVFLVLCDALSRNLGTSSDIPIGVVTSFVGAPFFVYLIVRKRRG